MRSRLPLLLCSLLLIVPAWADTPTPSGGPTPLLQQTLESLGRQLDSDVARIRDLGSELTIHHHDLNVTLDPEAGVLAATTTETLEIRMETRRIHLLLFRDFVVESVTVQQGTRELSTTFTTEMLRSDQLIDQYISDAAAGHFPTDDVPDAIKPETIRSQGLNVQIVAMQLPSFTKVGDELTVTMTYRGPYGDLDMSPFSGEAVYLNGAKFWFPDVLGPLSTFDLTCSLPSTWQAWSQGRLLQDRVESGTRQVRYRSDVRQGQIVLIAGDYTVERETLDGIEFASFLFPETRGKVADAPLMKKSEEYVQFFAERVGPYPFESFAVIETHASVGEGYPSFTLLGGHVINAHFLDPYALGHEILHCWFGNHVIWSGAGGNWTEGITFYLANLLYDEVHQGPEFAAQQRKLHLEDLSYALRWDEVPAINEFVSTNDERYSPDANQNAGYHKLGLLIHGWRTWLGDEAFFAMLQRFVREYGGKTASLTDLTGLLFESLKAQGKASGNRDAWVQAYAATWYDQRGMPLLVLDKVTQQTHSAGALNQIALDVQISDFRASHLPPTRVVAYSGATVWDGDPVLDIRADWNTEAELVTSLSVPSTTLWLEIDPGYDLLRWVPDAEKTASLEFLRRTGPTSLVMTEEDIQFLANQQFDLPRLFVGPSAITLMPPEAAEPDRIALTNIFAIGTLDDEAWIHDLITVPYGVEFNGRTVATRDLLALGEYDAVFRLVKQPEHPEYSVGVVYGRTQEAVLTLLRKLPFYPMDSWIALKDGKVVNHGRDPVEHRLLRQALGQ